MRDDYLMKYCKRNIDSTEEKTLKAASIRKYLKSYVDFLHYVVVEKVHVPNILTEDILNLKLRAMNWRKSYLGTSKEENLLAKSEIYDMIVDQKQVAIYELSEHAMSAKYLLKHYEENPRSPTQKDYVCVRDHLFTVVHFTNASRSGVTSNMKMDEFEHGGTCLTVFQPK